jgi:hypothetical protein
MASIFDTYWYVPTSKLSLITVLDKIFFHFLPSLHQMLGKYLEKIHAAFLHTITVYYLPSFFYSALYK